MVVGHYPSFFCFPPAESAGTLEAFLRVPTMPHNSNASLPPIIEDIILNNRIRSLEDALAFAERAHPSDPSLPAGRTLLEGMKCEQARRQDACAAMLAADPDDMDALIAGDNICRALFRHWFDEFR